MKQREVTDKQGTNWTCVQAYAGLNKEAAKRVEQLTEDQQQVTVVCTPSGGAQTVRLQLPEEWLNEKTLTDESLAEAITAAQQNT